MLRLWKRVHTTSVVLGLLRDTLLWPGVSAQALEGAPRRVYIFSAQVRQRHCGRHRLGPLAAMLPTRSPSPVPKRIRAERVIHESQPPPPRLRIQALQNAESCVAFTVLSDTIAPSLRIDDAVTSGSLGFHGPQHPIDDLAHMLQLSWASSSDNVVKERTIATPGLAAAGHGLPLVDVLVEFMDCLLTMPKDFRLVTYHIEVSASIILREMHRCGLRCICQKFEDIVRVHGHCLMDPTIHGYLSDSPPSYPSLEEIAESTLPLGSRHIPKFMTGGDECLMYLRFAKGQSEATTPECTRTGHVRVRATMRLAMRDNGSICSISFYPAQAMSLCKRGNMFLGLVYFEPSLRCFDYECERCGVVL